MALILSLETTTKVCSVAVSENDRLLALVESNDADYGHAEKLHVYIDQAIAEAGISLQQLNAVAVAGGPGSYTGLRIGVSAAKGLCFGLDIPLIAVDPLKALALQFLNRKTTIGNSLVVPMIDARRDEVFMSVFDTALNETQGVSAEIITADFFDSYQAEKIYLVGDGAPKFAEIFQGNDRVEVLTNCLASAKSISVLAYEKFKQNNFVDLVYYEPFYGKEFKTTVSTKLNKIRPNQ